MALNFVGGDAMAQTPLKPAQEAESQQSGDFAKLKARLGDFVAKIKKSTKDDISALYNEAKALKDEIASAKLPESELDELKKMFNDAIDLVKLLK